MVFGNGATGGVIGVGMVVSLYDNVSKNADNVMGKFRDLEGITDAAATKMVGAMDRIHLGFGLLAVGGAMMASIAFPIKSAIEFESAFTGVRKTVNATEQEFKQIESNFRNISKNAPITAVALSKIGEMAGQLGVKGVDNITKFTDTISKLSVTTNLTAEAGSTQFARIANIMQEPIANVERMGSTVVSLGNNFATTESEITAFTNRIAGAGQIAGLSTSDLMGIGAAFSSVGVEAERGGTAVSKTLFKMAEASEMGGEKLNQFAEVAGMTATQFSDLFKNDAAGAFNQFVSGLSKEGVQAVGLLDELELSDQRLKQAFISVAGAGGIMENAISSASKAWSENTALTNEAELRYNTVASQLQIMKNNFGDLFITIGQFFLPVMKIGSSILRGFASVLNAVASTGIGKVILSVVAAVAVLTAGIGLYLVVSGAATFASAKMAVMFAAMGKTAIATTFANAGLTAGFFALAGAIWTAIAPLLPFLAIGVAIVGVFILIKKSVSMFGDVMTGATEPLSGFMGKMQKIGGVIKGVVEIWKSATSESFSLSGQTHAALKKLGIAELVVNLGTWVARIKAFFVGLGSVYAKTWEGIKPIIKSIVASFNKLGDVFGIDIGKSISDISLWTKAGEFLGFVLTNTIIPSFKALAFVINMSINYVMGLINAFKFVWNIGSGLLSWISAIPKTFLAIGKAIVNSIMEGISTGWSSLVSMLLDLFASLPGGAAILKFFGVGEGAENVGNVSSTPETTSNRPTSLGMAIGETKSYSKSSETITNTNSERTEVLSNVNLFIDGKQVAASVDKQSIINDSRN